jgi:MFS family permease
MPGDLRRLPVFYGWVLVATAFVTMGIVVNARTAFSLFFPAILDEFGWSRALTAATFTTGLLSSNALTPFLGVLMDRLGPRVVFSAGLTLVSLGLALATAAEAPWHPVERRYREADPGDALAAFRQLRGESLARLATAPVEALAHVGASPSGLSLSGLDIVAAWVTHDRLHLRQLAATLARLWADRWAPLRADYAGPIPYARAGGQGA